MKKYNDLEAMAKLHQDKIAFNIMAAVAQIVFEDITSYSFTTANDIDEEDDLRINGSYGEEWLLKFPETIQQQLRELLDAHPKESLSEALLWTLTTLSGNSSGQWNVG